MPSSWHDAIVQMIRAEPGLALQIARDWGGADLPVGLASRLESPAFNDRLSADFAADVVVSAGPASQPSHALIVEPQQQETAEKLAQWPRYTAAAWLMLRCPVHVLVICRRPHHWLHRPGSAEQVGGPRGCRAGDRRAV